MTFYSELGILVRAEKRGLKMKYRTVPPVSPRLLALGTLRKTCPECKRTDVVVGGPQEGHWIVQNHSPEPGGTVACRGIGVRIPLTPKEKASP